MARLQAETEVRADKLCEAKQASDGGPFDLRFMVHLNWLVGSENFCGTLLFASLQLLQQNAQLSTLYSDSLTWCSTRGSLDYSHMILPGFAFLTES